MKIVKQIKVIVLFIYSKRAYYVPGMILFFILFLASTILNFSFTYMGNKSDRVLDVVLKTYKFELSFQVIKILVAYLLIGAAISIVIHAAVKEAQKRFNIKILLVPLITSFGILFFAFIIISKMFIHNPQLYVENFASHSEIFKAYLFFLTDYINPLLFDLIILLFLISILSFILLSIDWRSLKKVSQTIFKTFFKIKTAVIAVIIFTLIILYNQRIILYNNAKKLPNILILSADAVRPDHMSFNGYRKNTTPDIDKLAKGSLQIKRTFTTVPRTFPAWVSLLCSKYPLTHGINHMFPRTRERNVRFETAVNFLNKAGYRTAVISDFAGDIFPRIDMGFKKVIAPDMTSVTVIKQILLEKQTFLLPFITNKAGLFFFPEMRDLAKLSFPALLTEETCEEIGSSRGGSFFIIVFYSITHFPFSPPYPYYKKFTDPKYSGTYKYFKDRVVKLDANTALQEKISEKDKEQINALYDGCLNLFDNETGKIIAYLEKQNLLDNTVIAITSDHGENLYERDFGMGHGEHLKGNYSLEVPLIIYSSKLKKKGHTIELTSSSVDIMPTIFDIAGFAIPACFDGTSILKKSEMKNPHGIGMSVEAYCETGMWFDNDKSSPYFFHHQRIDYPDFSGVYEIDFTYKHEAVILQKYQNIVNGAKHRAIYSGRYKLIYIPLAHGPVYELYDYISDPENKNDLSSVRKDILENMKKKFYSFVNEKSSGNFIIKDGMLFPAFTDPVF